MKTLFEICSPHPDILKGDIREADFAADLAQVINGTAPSEYASPNKFFANTHPTQGLKALLKTVCQRLQGVGGSAVLRWEHPTFYSSNRKAVIQVSTTMS